MALSPVRNPETEGLLKSPAPTDTSSHQSRWRMSRKWVIAGLTAIAVVAGTAQLLCKHEPFQLHRGAFRKAPCEAPIVPPPEYLGPHVLAPPPFLRETNPAPFKGVPYLPNDPLEVQVPVDGDPNGTKESIFRLQGELTHYYQNPDGFGVDEHPLPAGARIEQLHMVSRHGARNPPGGYAVSSFGKKLERSIRNGTFHAAGKLAFLNKYRYNLGLETLVPVGRQELFQSGTLHFYQYGHLASRLPSSRKLVVRSTTQHRMLESAQYFLAGFFGLDWQTKVDLQLQIEATGFNNTLAGYFACPNSNPDRVVSYLGSPAAQQWQGVYLKDAAARFNALTGGGFVWTPQDVHEAQTLCAYETIAFGFSNFCSLFTHDEWVGYEYSADIYFAGNYGFQSPTSRAVAAGWIQEFLARLEKRYINEPAGQVNVTLSNNPATFPLDQPIYFDFSHDSEIVAILVGLNFRQFATFLPADRIVDRWLRINRVTPFAARIDVEVISTPKPVKASRSASQSADSDNYEPGKETKYIHFLLNQRTIPLGKNIPACGNRDDGWCELSVFLAAQKDALAKADFDYACYGDYGMYKYGELTDGAPLRKSRV